MKARTPETSSLGSEGNRALRVPVRVPSSVSLRLPVRVSRVLGLGGSGLITVTFQSSSL